MDVAKELQQSIGRALWIAHRNFAIADWCLYMTWRTAEDLNQQLADAADDSDPNFWEDMIEGEVYSWTPGNHS